jgi:hypothetical protein
MSTRTPICISPQDTLPYPMKSTHKKSAPLALAEKFQTDVSYHQRRCTICNHPQCYYIELDFLDWRSPAAIAKRYGIRDRASLYRHAHATGLFAYRRRNIAMALDNIIERADEVKITGSAVIRAVRARTRISDEGEWVDPPNRNIVTHLNPSRDGSQNPFAPINRAGSPGTTPSWPDQDAYWRNYLIATKNQTKSEPTP